MIGMAMRKGEVLGLPTDAADEVEQVLDISYQLQRVGGKLPHRETETATSDDVLPIPPIAATAIRLRRKQRDVDRKEADVSWQESGLLFTTRHGTPIEPRNFNRSWDRRCEKGVFRRSLFTTAGGGVPHKAWNRIRFQAFDLQWAILGSNQ
ncbi:hypothetical protein ACWEIJ_37235 [Lentzea sp. NPDC004789]